MTEPPDEDTASEKGREQDEKLRHPPFIVVLHQFGDTLDALRDLHSSATPLVAELDTKRLSPGEMAAVQGLPAEKQALLAEWLDDLRKRESNEGSAPKKTEGAPSVDHPRRQQEPERDHAQDEPTMARAEDSSDGDQDSLTQPAEGGGTDDAESSDARSSEETESGVEDAARDSDIEALKEIFGTPENPAIARVLIKLYRAAAVPTRKWLLNGSLLTMGVAAFEVAVVGIRTQHHVQHPATLDAEKEFTLGDLRGFESIADAEDEAIARRVDDFIRQGDLADWLRWFDDQTKLNSRSYAIDYELLSEVFQRRHIIVHNAGRVSRLYLQKCDLAETERPELGEHLHVEDDYLERAFDELDALGTLLIVGAWSKWVGTEEGLAMDRLADRIYDLMLAGRWLVVQRLAEVGAKVRTADQHHRLVFQVNNWLAHKRLGDLESVRKAVERWDTTALDTRFRLAQACLLDRLDDAFDLALTSLKAAELGLEALTDWPLLEELRSDQRFDGLLSAAREEAGPGHVLRRANDHSDDPDSSDTHETA